LIRYDGKAAVIPSASEGPRSCKTRYREVESVSRRMRSVVGGKLSLRLRRASLRSG